MDHSTLGLEDMEALINWKIGRYADAKERAQQPGVTAVQDQITIELRVDFADKDKIPELIKVATAMARTLVANVQLLGPTHKPECVVFTDNFMSPPEKIDIYADLIGTGHTQLAEAGDTATVTEDSGVSAEMLAAMK